MPVARCILWAMKYAHALPDGSVATRESRKSYAWAVVVLDKDKWGVWRWSASYASATAYAAALQRRGFDTVVEEINNGARK